ncbi:ribosome hibernation-promoting factor, HPF/YfiA family [Salibacter sp.]|jgi:putative sigma-54 modulation protein|uniref:ribosome hibernation-promoting factor, HPF/YfiA family n=1 Tax=Salibacter sp. TaxID=2010995 RepID=UPI00286FEBC6|nr:ribosome-associated translation inhibitor RaiA [Salibacter sp.]MDR9397943.1 ribosome-associated translation inhibitor RaiA [Salibacter sp.]MDR9486471.1 ribosome-associated translation inhibitor RaiA [Salibacter sp.]
MKLDIQSVHFDADQKLVDFIQRKADKLEQYFDGIISGEVILRVENTEDKTNKIVEMKLEIPGNNPFAKKQCKTFEEATDSCVEALRRQIKKTKEKLRTH